MEQWPSAILTNGGEIYRTTFNENSEMYVLTRMSSMCRLYHTAYGIDQFHDEPIIALLEMRSINIKYCTFCKYKQNPGQIAILTGTLSMFDVKKFLKLVAKNTAHPIICPELIDKVQFLILDIPSVSLQPYKLAIIGNAALSVWITGQTVFLADDLLRDPIMVSSKRTVIPEDSSIALTIALMHDTWTSKDNYKDSLKNISTITNLPTVLTQIIFEYL